MPDRKPAKGATGRDTTSEVWTDEERAAMQEHARDMKAQKARGAKKADGLADLRAKIAAMPDKDRVMAERIHEVVMAAAPDLEPRTWYGMPAYNRNGKLICFFQAAAKFKARYATFGFEENAKLDEGSMWATSWALTELTAADEKRITDLVKRAVT